MHQINPLFLIGASFALACIPIVIGISTSYLKVSIVLGLVKNALGTQNTPGSLVVTALSLALTWFIMMPTFSSIYSLLEGKHLNPAKMNFSNQLVQDLVECLEPLRAFLRDHAGIREKNLFNEIRVSMTHKETDESGTYAVLVPAFMLSELKSSFQMGFVVLLPFLVIDLVVANILAGLGMYMMSPTTIALPLKLLLFVQSNAWILLVKGLVQSYGG